MKSCDHPFLARVPECLSRDVPSEEEVEQRIRESLAQMSFVPYEGPDPLLEERGEVVAATQEKTEAICGLPPDAYKAMLAYCGGCFTPEDVCLKLEWDRAREGTARKDLEAAGLLAMAGRVGHYKVHEPTDKGRRWARQSHTPVASRITKGGAVHAFCLKRVVEVFGAAVPGTSFRKSGLSRITGGVQPDTLARLRDGTTVAIQISHKNQAGYEARRLLDLCDVRAVDRVASVASSRAGQERIEKELKRMCRDSAGSGELPEKLGLFCVTECLSESFDWRRMTGGAGADG